jgi:hypothetical protein
MQALAGISAGGRRQGEQSALLIDTREIVILNGRLA